MPQHWFYLLLLPYYLALFLWNPPCFWTLRQIHHLILLKFGSWVIPFSLAKHTSSFFVLASLPWTLFVAFFVDLPSTSCKSNRSMANLLLTWRFQEAYHQHSQQTCPLLLFYSGWCHPRRWRQLGPIILSFENPQLPLWIPYSFHAQSHSLYGSIFDSHHNRSSVYHPCLHLVHQRNTPESSNHTSDFPCKAWRSIHRMWPLFYHWGWLSVS